MGLVSLPYQRTTLIVYQANDFFFIRMELMKLRRAGVYNNTERFGGELLAFSPINSFPTELSVPLRTTSFI